MLSVTYNLEVVSDERTPQSSDVDLQLPRPAPASRRQNCPGNQSDSQPQDSHVLRRRRGMERRRLR